MSDSRQLARTPAEAFLAQQQSSPRQHRKQQNLRQPAAECHGDQPVPKMRTLPAKKSLSSPRLRKNGGSASAFSYSGSANSASSARRLNVSPRERKRNAPTRAEETILPLGKKTSAVKLSLDAEYYRVWMDHPRSMPRRSRKVDASTLTDSSPTMQMSRRPQLLLGQRSASGPNLPIQETDPMEGQDEGNQDTPDSALLVPDSEGMLSIVVPSLEEDFTTEKEARNEDNESNVQEQVQEQPSTAASIGPTRRPKSLTHQSVGSNSIQGGLSLFGSLDSEQSVPRTAPLATPEQDNSLIDVTSVDNLELSRNAVKVTEQPSLEGYSDEVFVDHPMEPASSSSNTTSSNSSGQRNPRLSELRQQAFGDTQSAGSRNTSLDVATNTFEEDMQMDISTNAPETTIPAAPIVGDPSSHVSNNNHDESTTSLHCPQLNFESPPTTDPMDDEDDDDEVDDVFRSHPHPSRSSPIAYLSAPAAASEEGLTPSPMSISENLSSPPPVDGAMALPLVHQRGQVPGPSNDESDDDVFKSPEADKHCLKLPSVDPIDPSILGAVGFSVEITPPPGTLFLQCAYVTRHAHSTFILHAWVLSLGVVQA